MIQNRGRTFPFSRPPREPALVRERTELENAIRFLQEELDVLRNEINALQETTDSSNSSALSLLSMRVLAVEQAIASLQAILTGLDGVFQPLDPDLTSISAMATQGYVRRLIGSIWQTVSTIPWADIAGTPTTVAGYGITDAVTHVMLAQVAYTGNYNHLTQKPALLGDKLYLAENFT